MFKKIILILLCCVITYCAANVINSYSSSNMVGIGLNSSGHYYFSTFNNTNGSQSDSSTYIQAIFEQGIGSYCNKTKRFYAPIQRVNGHLVYNNIISIDVSNGNYTLSDHLPFVVYQVQGYGHSLAIDQNTCDVYVVGRSHLSEYLNAHTIYKYNDNSGLSFVMSLDDNNTEGECMVVASAFDDVNKNLWILQQLPDDMQVNLHAFNVVTKKLMFTVDNQMGLCSLNYDKKNHKLYGFIAKHYESCFMSLVQIDPENGNVKIVKDYDNINDIIISDTTINNLEHKLYSILGSDSKFAYTTISLDTFEIIEKSHSVDSFPFIMASTI